VKLVQEHIYDAMSIIISISGSEKNLSMANFMEASALVQDKVNEEIPVCIRCSCDDSFGDEVRVTIIAAGVSSIRNNAHGA
jgi:cell division protein FtsZ